jgi:hypothetical protein
MYMQAIMQKLPIYLPRKVECSSILVAKQGCRYFLLEVSLIALYISSVPHVKHLCVRCVYACLVLV